MAFPNSDLPKTVSAYLGADPTAAPGTWPAATDLSDRLTDTPIRITMGRGSGQKTLQSGSATLEMHNLDGWLTPLNPSSPYYGAWDLGVPVSLDADGVGASPPYGRYRGYVASVEPTIRPGAGGKDWSTVKVTLGGVIRRLGMGKKPLRSAPYRAATLPAAAADLYWSLESDEQTTTPAALAGDVGSTPAMRFRASEMEIGAADHPASAPLPEMTMATEYDGAGLDTVSAARLAGDWSDPGAGVTSWSLSMLVRAVIPDATKYYSVDLLRLKWATGDPDSSLSIVHQATGGTVGYGCAFVPPTTFSVVTLLTDAGHDMFDGGWHEVYVKAYVTGGTTSHYETYVDGALWTHITKASGTILRPVGLYGPYMGLAVDGAINADNRGLRIAYGHMRFDWPFGGPFVDALRGYAGEVAGDRFERLCTEEGIPFVPVPGDSYAMGPQPVGLDIVEQLRDVETADHGILYELVDDWGVGYRPLAERYALLPSITVDLSTYAAKDAASLLSPVRDDSRVRNELTVGRPNGGAVTLVDAGHQAKHGRYDSSLTVNVAADSQLDGIARWLMHEGTHEGWRYGAPNLDLAANLTLLAAWLESTPGDRIDFLSLPAYFSPDAARSVIEGYTETLGRRSWTAQPVVEPYGPLAVGVWQPDPAGRPSKWGSATATLTAGINSSVASFLVTETEVLWSTTASGYLIEIDGERMTLSSVVGAVSPQTFTVVRSVNGVVKSHLANAPVRIVDTGKWGL